MTMAKKLPLLAPSIHTFEVNGTYTDCEAKRTVFMAIQKMVSAGKYYRIPYHGSSKKGYSYKRKDGGLTITLADYPDFKKRYITLSGVNLARIAGDPSRLSLTDLSPEGLVMQEQAFLDELEQLGLLEIEESVKWKMHRLDITQDFYVKCDPSLMVKIIRYAGSVDPYRKGRALHYNQHNEIRSCKFEKTWYDFALYDKHQQLLNCEKESYPISPDDLERSKNLIRYEIQLKRPSLKEFEHDKLESSKLRFRNHALFHYFDKISDDIPFFLYRYAVDFFGKHSWYNVPTALKAVQTSNLDDDMATAIMNCAVYKLHFTRVLRMMPCIAIYRRIFAKNLFQLGLIEFFCKLRVPERIIRQTVRAIFELCHIGHLPHIFRQRRFKYWTKFREDAFL